jgi:hypothetical protein
MILPPEIKSRGDILASILWVLDEAHGEPAGLMVGQRLEQNTVDDAEDGGVGADAQGQAEDGGGREARMLPKGP